MFLAGAVQLVLVMLIWFAELASRNGWLGDTALPFVIASTWVHVFLMLYGLFTFFIYGFLFTVFPRWMGGAEVPRRRYMTVWTLAVTGMALIYAGFFSDRLLLAAGMLIFLIGWLLAIPTLLTVYRASAKRRRHELLLLGQLAMGAIGLALFIYSVLGGNAYGFVLSRQIGLWGFLIPLLLTVCHRMIPFFTQSALPFMSVPRPEWSLGVLVGGSLLHGVFDLFALTSMQLLVDLLLAGVALHHAAIWGLRRSFSVRLLAMLHVAFLWFGIAMLLYVVQAALALAGVAVLGRAPLHALAMGFITGTLIAMATRVTLGHSGRALAVKAPTWYLFLALTVGVTLTRMAAEIVPSAYLVLNLVSAGAWLLLLIPWAARYVPIYLRPRADGRPG